jgi:LPXTG-motif cell wall-anchored protein
MIKQKNLWMALLLVFTLIIGGFQTPVFAAEQGKQGTITVIGNDEVNPIVLETNVLYGEAETATQALIKAVGAENIEFTDTTYGKMLTAINGVVAEGTHFWAFFINGISAQAGADTYVVQNGDKLTFRYTDWTKTPQNTVSLKVVDSGKNTVNELSGIEVINNPTAFQLLQVGLGPDKVGFSETAYGKMITSINGIEATGTQFWAFYIDGKMASVGADSYPLQPGNQISFQLESWQDTPESDDNGEADPNLPSGTVSEATLQQSVDAVSQYVLKNELGEWEVIALRQAGKTIPTNYYESIKVLVKEKQGKFSRITDTERYVLGILAAGGDPTNVEGYNLIERIYNGNVTKQGLNGVAYALIALDSANFSIPDNAQWSREKLVSLLLKKQNVDGGWAWDESTTSDVDTTAMILTALAPYKDQVEVKVKVETAVQYLSSQYKASKIDNSSTAAQVIIALSALGIDANSLLFVKDSGSLLQFFLTFQNEDGGFDWQSGDESDIFSTSQGLQGIVAYQLFSQGQGSLYQMTLAEQKPETVRPVAERPVVEQPSLQPPDQTNETNGQNSNELPNTATNLYNLLALGLLLIIIGSVFYFNQKKVKA